MPLHPQLDEIINVMLPFVQQFHAKAQLAPHAASVNRAGEVVGAALINEGNRTFTIDEALSHFESKFREEAKANEIVASAIFFHGGGQSDLRMPAQTEDEAQSIVARLEHKTGDSVFLVIPYTTSGGEIQYEMGKLGVKPPSIFLEPAPSSMPAKPWWRFW